MDLGKSAMKILPTAVIFGIVSLATGSGVNLMGVLSVTVWLSVLALLYKAVWFKEKGEAQVKSLAVAALTLPIVASLVISKIPLLNEVSGIYTGDFLGLLFKGVVAMVWVVVISLVVKKVGFFGKG